MILERLIATGLINREVWTWLEKQDALAWQRYLRCQTNHCAAKRWQEFLEIRRVFDAYFIDAVTRLDYFADKGILDVLGASERPA